MADPIRIVTTNDGKCIPFEQYAQKTQNEGLALLDAAAIEKLKDSPFRELLDVFASAAYYAAIMQSDNTSLQHDFGNQQAPDPEAWYPTVFLVLTKGSELLHHEPCIGLRNKEE